MIYITLILSMLVIGALTLALHGKVNLKLFVIPWLILLISEYLFLTIKFDSEAGFLAQFFYLPAIIFALVGIIWMIILLFMSAKAKDSKRILISILCSILVIGSVALVPSMKYEDKYKLYKGLYTDVAVAMFECYDSKKIAIGEQLNNPPNKTESMNKILYSFDPEIISKMGKLNNNAGICTLTMADKDVIYFSFGSGPIFQSVDGIAVCRNGKDPGSDSALKAKYFDGNTTYTTIVEGVYYFKDGM
jgi:hypothetical protein